MLVVELGFKLDKDIKLGNIDKYVGFELFILNFGG